MWVKKFPANKRSIGFAAWSEWVRVSENSEFFYLKAEVKSDMRLFSEDAIEVANLKSKQLGTKPNLHWF